MSAVARRIAHSSAFQYFITLVIVLAGALVGFETSPAIVAEHGDLLHALDRLVLGVFVVEIIVKLAAEGSRPWRYFRDPFNVFDFGIVAVTLLPFGGQYVTVLRLLRLLRVLRLVHALPRLQILVSALLKSIPSMAYVGVFLGLLFYVYGVGGVFLFGKNDPAHFGSLGVAMLTLFTVVTLEGWAELMYTQLYGCVPGEGVAAELCKIPEPSPLAAPFYFITFILFGTMIVLNLFIGVIMNSMQEAATETSKAEEAKLRLSRGEAEATEQEQLAELRQVAEQMAERIALLQKRREAR
ncbi:MAG: Ion transport protein [Polyangiaceae bacterium]|jgi:voltage-gated sodium channel|nr:Ion transport protein [Polyangiaceae bacterium]